MRSVWWLIGGILASVPSLAAQPRANLQPSVFAIRDARVIVEPGRTLDKATVVIRDGVIEAVSAKARVPADAVVIDGHGLTVCAGFIDALSHWGIDPTQPRSAGGPASVDDLAAEPLIATKLDHRKGITPEFAVRGALKADGDASNGWRRAGFTARLAAPEGGIWAGRSALVSLSGAPPRLAVIQSPVALHAALRTVPGSDYPRSKMGAIAHARQTLLDAGWHHRQRGAFEKRGRVGPRPITDPAWETLAEALAGQLPVAFEADRRDDIHTALDFAAEFRLKPILVGARDAWKLPERVKAEAVPVVVRLPTLDEPEESVKDWPRRVLAERRQQSQQIVAGPAQLHRAGIRFAFGMAGLPGDKPWERVRSHLRHVIDAGLPADEALRALTTTPAEWFGVSGQLGRVRRGLAAHLIVSTGHLLTETNAQVKYVFIEGAKFEYDIPPRSPKNPEPKKPARERPLVGPPAPIRPAEVCEIDADRVPRIQTGGTVLIHGATIWTGTGAVIEHGFLVIKNGRIVEVGTGNRPRDWNGPIIDATGMVVTPGIIDTHSHFAISGGVNEFSLSVVPEVRVRDVIDSDDVQIYRALAGGVTTARLLHGSANCIGGQDAVIKLKWGQPARELLVRDGPRGVKFALGENVKRTDGRFPNTRLGVEAVLVRAFSEAQAYRKAWQRYEASRRGEAPPVAEPRRDLRLEALADVLAGELKVHCHCYRADEILMLLRVADRFGFKVRSLQHALEGYKVAPEIAAHGASNSTFSDWWAYKIEAYDAIPYNTAMLAQAGAEVCLKSDSNELVRHMYQEAAKCIKYGGMSETAAWQTITLNGARQLGLEHRIGTIEKGKDADLAIFNGHPLNAYSRCEMTLVDGEVYFQRAPTFTPLAAARAKPARPVSFAPIPVHESGRYVLQNIMVHRPDGSARPASVAIEKKRIVAVDFEQPKRGGTGFVRDASGLHLYPGMIDAGTVLGLTELGSARETQDHREGGDFQPDLRASTALNPDSELIPVTRANGVLTAVTRPTGGVIAGQAALINLAGWTPSEMTLVDPLALQIEFPASSSQFHGDSTLPTVFVRGFARKQREEKIRRLKELFRQAIVHDEAQKNDPDYPANPRLDALIPYARGRKPIIIQAYRKPEILEALKLSDEMKWKIIISGGLDAWRVADELKKRDVPVILGPIHSLPTEKFDPYDAPFACAARLHQAGVRFCIRSSGSTNCRNLPYEAAMAVSYGLPPAAALNAVTLAPAQILGMDQQLGSIDVGKRANLVITNGDILQPSTVVLALFIDGQPIEPTNKQTRLYDRYRQRLRP